MKISVVVPTRNSARTLRACLTSLRHQTHPDVEVVVVDNASTDGTADIARELADVAVDRGPERSAQRNHGTARSTGDVVLFVDSDMVLEPQVLAEVAAVLEARPEVGAVVVPERSFGDGFFTDCRILEKSLYVGADDVEAPRAFRREVIEGVGGWAEHLTAAEDWDLADRCHAAGVVTGRVQAWIWHDEGRLRLRGTFSKKRYYGRWIAAYLEEHRGEGGRRLAHTSLFRDPVRLLSDPVHAGGMFLLKSVEASGLAAGMLDARLEGRREARGSRRGSRGAGPAEARMAS